ncbi:hypothetical protein ACSBR1_011751 [Camellia fascicularis]
MGRPPSNGGPVFRFNHTEVAEMETILQEHNTQMPTREVLVALADRFSASVERSGKIVVQMKQVWNWFTNRRHALRSKAKYPRTLNVSPIAWDDSSAVINVPQTPQSVTAPVSRTMYLSNMPWDDSAAVRNVPQVPQSVTAPVNSTIYVSRMPWDDSTAVRNVPQPHQSVTAPVSFSAVQSAGRAVSDKNHTEFKAKSAMDGVVLPSLSFSAVQSAERIVSDKYHMEFEAKSARDGSWYDVAMFMSHRSLEKGDAEVLVHFAGLGPEEDEWVNICRNVRPRSLPCEPSECAAILPGDLVLCFQDGKEQALYFDAHVLDVRKRRHDLRGCRCRFRVHYDHDESEEIVPLRKICRRPETDYRFRQLRGINKSSYVNRRKIGADTQTGNTLKAYSSPEPMQKQQKVEEPDILQPKIPKISTGGDAANTITGGSSQVATSMVPPANVVVTSGDATSGFGQEGTSMVLPANIVVTSAAAAITGGSAQVGTSMVPQANVAVTSGAAVNTIITSGSVQNMAL